MREEGVGKERIDCLKVSVGWTPVAVTLNPKYSTSFWAN